MQLFLASLIFEWDADPLIFTLFGKFPIQWYGLLFALGGFLGYSLVKRIMLKEGWELEKIDQLAFYIFVGTIVGARLGHCLFYEPGYYLQHPLEMILPFKIKDGEFIMTGYRGLASHGGILAVFIAIWYFARKNKVDIFEVLDKISVGGCLTAVFIRLANFTNSEIIGKATNADYGVIFKKVDDIPRHPAQLYESFAYFLIFITLFILYKKANIRNRKGFLFGLFFASLFIARFIIEFFKINQVAFEDNMTFNMGQLLSVLPAIAGIIVMIWKWKQPVVGKV